MLKPHGFVVSIPIAIGTAFASLKKYASHFFNSAFGGTEPKEALYETTGIRCEVLKSKSRITGWNTY